MNIIENLKSLSVPRKIFGGATIGSILATGAFLIANSQEIVDNTVKNLRIIAQGLLSRTSPIIQQVDTPTSSMIPGTPTPPNTNTPTPTNTETPIPNTATNTPLPPTPTDTPTSLPPSETPTPTPTETPTEPACGLWEYYASDYVDNAHPDMDVAEVTQMLHDIASRIPAEIPFDAEACKGIVPNPATGGVEGRPESFTQNVPEGGFAYQSTGNANVVINGAVYSYPNKNGNVFLNFQIGKPDDATPSDLNTNAQISDFPPGHLYYNQAAPQQGEIYPDRQVVDQAWFAQQLLYAAQSGSNCGVGCESTITISMIDVETGDECNWVVDPNSFEWKKVTAQEIRSELRKQESLAGKINKQKLSGGDGNINPLYTSAGRRPFSRATLSKNQFKGIK